jgi:hypothetical protein
VTVIATVVAAVIVVAVVAAVIFVAAVILVIPVVTTVIFIAAARGVPVELMAMAVPMELAVLSVMRIFAMVPVALVIAVIYISVPAVGTMEPWACSEEDAIPEPFWTVIAIGSAIVGGVIEVSIGTDGGRSHVHAEAKRHLGFCR